MLYYVQPKDTLFRIARRFNTTVDDILEANVICNPDLIFPGLPLIIPEPELELPTAGGGPYYVVLPEDTLWCLAREFNRSVGTLAQANQIEDPSLIYAYSELLIPPDIPDPTELKESWQRRGDQYCNMINPLMEYGIFYLGTFMWEALGQRAIPYLLDLLNHPCDIVQIYTIISLGRLAINELQVKQALRNIANDSPSLAGLANLTLQRIQLVQEYGDRIHIITTSNQLLSEPDFEEEGTRVEPGTEIMVLRWHIPSPTGEISARGEVELFDQAIIISTGEIGFLPRFGYNQITFI
ncbi:hypothetical protein JCM16358_02700 [Halanaerocella petrolearia]